MGYSTVVAIGRQYGSGGREIGELVSEMMGVPFFDRELIAIAAERSGVSRDIYAHIDETATNSLLYALSTGAYTFSSHFTTVSDLPLNDKLYIIQTNLIKDIVAEHGSCVIVGRCADYILKDDPRCASVFIHAPMKDRIKRIMEKEDLNAAAAESRIIKTDKKRANYYNFYTNREWGDMTHYELCIDSSVLGKQKTAELILDYIKRREQHVN
ncbi:MAG: cytidylate kinase-like family protein [Clostridia bacterium]|nr:cytidylate kinase-like family protein [Clostridia bacterium]